MTCVIYEHQNTCYTLQRNSQNDTTLCPKKTSPTFSTITWRRIIGF